MNMSLNKESSVLPSATRSVTRWGVAVGIGLMATLAHGAGDPVRGRLLYQETGRSTLGNGDSCEGCHLTNPTRNGSKIWLGAHAPSVIQNAINANNNGMGEMNYLSAQEVQDIAAYIGPTVVPSVASVTYPSTQVGLTSTATPITLTNYGIQLKFGSALLSGANAADFVISGETCSTTASTSAFPRSAAGILPDTVACTVQVAFRPTGSGTRSASLTISGSAANTAGAIQSTPAVSPVVVTLTGAGAAAPAPVQATSGSSLTYASTVQGTTTAAQSVTVSNTGNAAMTFSSITLGGANSGDFSLGGTCATATPVPAAGSCTVSATFTPQASAGTRTATISIVSNGGSSSVSLSGAAAAVPTPLVAWGSSSVAFSATQAGATSAASTVTLHNTGQAALSINSLSASPAVFSVASHTCGSSLAAGATCTVSLTFTPAAVQAYTGTLSLASNASGSPHTVSLSGTGTALPLPVASLAPSTVNFASTQVGSSSTATTVTLSNAGPGSLTLSQLTLVGTNPGDFTLSPGTCDVSAGVKVRASGASCQATVTFNPAQAGNRAATLQFSHDGTGAATVPLSGSAGAATAMSIDTSAVNLTWNAASGSSTTQIVTLGNPGTTVLNVALTNGNSLVTVTGQSACGAGSNATTIVIDPGQSCALTVAATGVVNSSTLVFNAGAAGSPVVSVAVVDGSSGGAAPASVTPPSTAATNVGAGGCSLGDPNSPLDPIWPAMTLAAAAVLVWRRVTRHQRSRAEVRANRH